MSENAQAPWLEIVRRKAGAIRYGSIQITLHDGRVTQVEITEKTRVASGPVPAVEAPQ